MLTLAVFGLSFVGLGISMFPYLVPNSITLQMAAAPASSQVFMLVGAARADSADPRLHRVVVLGVPRQGCARGLPLKTDAPLLRRLGWMALIWAISVCALGVVSLILRWWLK